MKTSRTLLMSCCVMSLFALPTMGAEIELVPISADGAHSISGDEITLFGGGQRVFLEIFLSDWDPEVLKVYQAAIQSTGYSSGSLGTIDPALEACTVNADCVAAFGTGATCSYVGHANECTPGFIDHLRADYVFACCQDLPFVDVSTLDYRFGSTLVFDTLADPGIAKYAGTLVLDVPVGAVGTFTVGFKPLPDSFMKNGSFLDISPLVLTPALITVNCQTNADCDDGDACTDDTCLGNGTCQNTPNYPATHCCNPASGTLTLIDDSNDCTEDICDPLTGDVSHPPEPFGTFCGPTPSGPCDAQDICNGSGTCLPQWAPNGTACGDPSDTDCTDPDSCDGSGNCLDNHEPGGTACGNPLDDDCTDPDTCDGAGSCDDNHEPPGTACGDPTDTDCDNPDTCDGSGGCQDNLEPNGTTCDDGEYCNVGEACQTGACVGGSARNCSDGQPCTTDTCDETLDQCDNDLDPGFCLITGVCRGEGETNPGNECEECNTALSTIDWSPKSGGTPCGSSADTDCTNPDTCDGAGSCDDNDEPPGTACGDPSDTDCTDPDTCDGGGTCVDNHEPNGTGCDDGQYCNVDEACMDGDCVGGSGRDCSDGVPCTDDTCDENLDVCVSTENDANCDNGDFCDGVEICDDVLDCIVEPGTVPDCDDLVPCTDDSCDEINDECVNDPNDANCNDGQYCNGVEICDDVQDCIVQPGSVPDCDDQIGCTDDSCDEVNDECDNVPNDSLCPDDGEFCNGNEYCDPVTDCDHTGSPCAGPCDEVEDTCLCEAPVVDVDLLSPRYLNIALQPPDSGPQAITLSVDCPLETLVLYVGPPSAEDMDGDGVVDENVAFVTTNPGGAAWLTPAEWGELYVTGDLIIPDTLYVVQGDCGSPGSPGPSDPTAVATALWGDVVGDYIAGEWTSPQGIIDFVDISSIVERFKASPIAPGVRRVDLAGPNGNECVPQQNFIDFVDILSCVEAFRGLSYTDTWQQCPIPCPF